jgi:hypothetical protein
MGPSLLQSILHMEATLSLDYMKNYLGSRVLRLKFFYNDLINFYYIPLKSSENQTGNGDRSPKSSLLSQCYFSYDVLCSKYLNMNYFEILISYFSPINQLFYFTDHGHLY